VVRVQRPTTFAVVVSETPVFALLAIEAGSNPNHSGRCRPLVAVPWNMIASCAWY